ncbi:VWA domain-containing protein [Pseudoroseicyclus tamaricis]|uniref:VWA domain-containing protein n=1 Tax=Pseudoroseicyclus tamaricis TaxID=2705421 RepID=A0A6B2JSY1_9RHOB|nr:VWA domain-containing protein [Pseudoroseicyclus tamaricis]NDU99678.1 VWA domain-containing protein [Pseudoroseicyclus tamaricis]
MTSGDDDLFDMDELRRAARAATPAPDAGKKAADLRLARENFAALQDSRGGARLTPDRPAGGPFRGVKRMLDALTSKAGLGLTTAVVACGLVLVSPAGEELFQRAPGLKGGSAPQPAVQGEGDAARIEPAGDWQDMEVELWGYDQPAVEESAPAGDAPEAAPRMAPPAPEAQTRMAPAPAEGEGFAPHALSRSAGDAMLTAPAPAPMAEMAPSFTEPAPLPQADTEAFANAPQTALKVTAEEPVSTFSIDVDTASWSVIRSSIMNGQLPPEEAVRIEEMINYFPYDLPAPEAGEAPFRPTIDVFETPWNAGTQLVRIALQGEMPAVADRPPLNLVFLVDTSGSMAAPDKLPLLQQSLRLMLPQLRAEDQVAIVSYAGTAGVALPPTAAGDRETILAALEGLGAGGSTNGQGGLEAAYRLAEEMGGEGEVSRVLLATDGDFNVGLSDPGALEEYIAGNRDSGTYLSVLGFGRGNLDDAAMQALAQSGNGQAAYIDTLSEARKVLVDQLTGALFPIAGDVKVQVEWNPAEIAEYRLIGYETRALAREDFANDRVDAGELGAGHQVTALYEITAVGSPARLTEDLRYAAEAPEAADHDGELGFLRLRWKAPGEDASQLLETPIAAGADEPGQEAAFAAAIAGFGQLLTGGDWLGEWGYAEAIALAAESRGEDPFGYRGEAVQLMRLAQALSE